MEKQWKQWQTLFSWTPESLQIVTEAVKEKKKKKDTSSLRGGGALWQTLTAY